MKINLDTFKYQFTRNQATNEEIHENILEGVNMYGSNFIILMCAIIIASIGLNMNSVAVIIGAMLISPLMGSIIGIGYGVATVDSNLIRKSIRVLIISIIISVVTSTVYFTITPITTAGSEILARTSPTIWDVIIALVGGIAGMVGLTRKKSSNVIPGVAIATALMPPLCTAGYGIATSQASIFLGAGYLFFINGFFIAIATFIVTKALKIPNKSSVDYERQRKVRHIIIISSIIVMIPSIISAVWMIRKTIYETDLNKFISDKLPNQYILSKDINYNDNTITLVTIGDAISNDKIKSLNESLEEYGLKDKKLIIKQEGMDLNNLEKYISSLKDNQNTVPTKINNTTSNSSNNTIDNEAIYKEISSIYPDIKQIYTGYINSENKEEGKVELLLIYTDKDDLNNYIVNIENWFKARLNLEKVKVIIEKI